MFAQADAGLSAGLAGLAVSYAQQVSGHLPCSRDLATVTFNLLSGFWLNKEF